jgi:ABC-2 type transport system ATP-binding protein
LLISTHNLDEVDRLADHVAVLRTRLVAFDTPAALRTRLFGSRVRVVLGRQADVYAGTLRAAGIADVRVDGPVLSIGVADGPPSPDGFGEAGVRTPAVVRLLVDAGAEIEEVTPEEAPLEEVYLRLLHPDGPQ